ncbi:NADH dehydrogenase [ubiquinone] 1 beta subcomplex subunit 3-B-like, partial [Mangifera indica]|uniref:NADH dehydrogenase [ubiquinone] 1 beta subcomplex subunit 3-B-like n=1 Tax=Mangifera indica TaxID=29780 RepID=UPI001CFC0FAC
VVAKKLKMGHTGEFFKRRDKWRKHPLLTSNLRQATPGLGIALVAFGIYLVGEQVYYRVIAPSPSHSQHHHKSSSASSSH